MVKRAQPSLDRVLDLQQFLIAFRDIERRIYMRSKRGDVRENDVEHSYHLAMVAWFLASYFPHLDSDKVIRYALVHDLVEVYAGDTFVFAGEDELATKASREAAAMKRIQKEWPDFSEMTDYIAGYERRENEEAKFVYALDKIMPIILNMLSDGFTWRTHSITLNQVHAVKKDKVTLSPEVNGYYRKIMEILKTKPEWFPPSTK